MFNDLSIFVQPILPGCLITVGILNGFVAVLVFRFKLKKAIEKRLGQKLVFTSFAHRISWADQLLGGVGEMMFYINVKFIREKIFRKPPESIKWLADCALAKANYQFNHYCWFEVFIAFFGQVSGVLAFCLGVLWQLNVIQISVFWQDTPLKPTPIFSRHRTLPVEPSSQIQIRDKNIFTDGFQ